MALLYMFRATFSPIIRSTYAVYDQWWNKSNKMQQLRFHSHWLYSTCFGWHSHPSSGVHMLYMANGEISTTRCNNCVFYSHWLYPKCFGWQSNPSSGIYMLYMANGEISPTRCNICVFYSHTFYSICFGWHSHTSSGVHMLYMANGEISPTRCNNCVFILRNDFTLHVPVDNLTHNQE